MADIAIALAAVDDANRIPIGIGAQDRIVDGGFVVGTQKIERAVGLCFRHKVRVAGEDDNVDVAQLAGRNGIAAEIQRMIQKNDFVDALRLQKIDLFQNLRNRQIQRPVGLRMASADKVQSGQVRFRVQRDVKKIARSAADQADAFSVHFRPSAFGHLALVRFDAGGIFSNLNSGNSFGETDLGKVQVYR